MELNNDHLRILNELNAKYDLAQRTTHSEMVGKLWFKGLETEIAHLLERGFIYSVTQQRVTDYGITAEGIRALTVINDPTNQLKAEIARLEAALAAARAELTAGDTLGEMRGFMGAKSDNLHEGE